MLNDDELMRYSRQILLPAFDVAGQLRLKKASVLVVGAGGLGCPVALYLGAAGVGRLTIADDDVIEVTNLQRQIAFDSQQVGRYKAEALAERVTALNPLIEVTALPRRLAGAALHDQVGASDLVIDCTDNFATRFAINQACVSEKTPLISGAAIRGEGQLSVFDFHDPEGPCYQCLYPDLGDQELSCSEAGVVGPLVGIIGACQAMEAIKLLGHAGRPLTSRLLVLDAWRLEWREMKFARDPRCAICGDGG